MADAEAAAGVLSAALTAADPCGFLCDALRDLVDGKFFEAAVLLRVGINKCLDLNVNEHACAEMALLLSRALTAISHPTLAQYYLEYAYEVQKKLWIDECSRLETGGEENDQIKERLCIICSTLGRALFSTGMHEEAAPYFQQCVAFRGTEAGRSILLPCLADLAGNMHALEQHEDAISILHVVKSGIVLESAAHPTTRFSFTECPTFLLGCCELAQGCYHTAVYLFLGARELAEIHDNPLCIAKAEMHLAVTMWARQECTNRAIIRMAPAYRNESFTGPALTPGYVAMLVVEIAACCCASTGGLAGKTGICVQLNARGDPVGVRRLDENQLGENALLKLAEISWNEVPRRSFNSRGLPIELVLTVTLTEGEEMTFTCQVGRTFLLTTQLSRYLQRAVSLTQGFHGLTPVFTPLILASLTTAQGVALVNGFFSLYETSTILLCFLRFETDGPGNEQAGLSMLQDYVQAQVDMLPDQLCHRGCRTCFELGGTIQLCGGCRVVRFCNRKHQEYASLDVFGRVAFPHKKLCPLMQLCKALQRCENATEEAGIRSDYNRAAMRFLRRDIFAEYVLKHDHRDRPQPVGM